jgi:hypothetical protein
VPRPGLGTVGRTIIHRTEKRNDYNAVHPLKLDSMQIEGSDAPE